MKVNNLIILTMTFLTIFQIVLGLVDDNISLTYFGLLWIFHIFLAVTINPAVSSKTEKTTK